MDNQKQADIVSRVDSLTRHLNNFQSELIALKHSLVTEPASYTSETGTIHDVYEEEIEFDRTFMMTKAEFGNVTVVVGDVMKQLKNDE